MWMYDRRAFHQRINLIRGWPSFTQPISPDVATYKEEFQYDSNWSCWKFPSGPCFHYDGPMIRVACAIVFNSLSIKSAQSRDEEKGCYLFGLRLRAFDWKFAIINPVRITELNLVYSIMIVEDEYLVRQGIASLGKLWVAWYASYFPGWNGIAWQKFQDNPWHPIDRYQYATDEWPWTILG